ncbi:MAG: hypothetical protein HYX47_08895 [Burkholderiales bacterium]|nr:hypothetical protein [Burkholderiales bacterium]
MRVPRLVAAFALCVMAGTTGAQAPAKPPAVHIIWMGGNDCPPCVAWRKSELPKLQASPEFAGVKFSYVTKSIMSSVPIAIFLPAEVRPYKDKLDYASSGRHGSPQAAIMVNGEVYDYFQGTRMAVDIEQMLAALRTGAPYPFKRCVKASREWLKCDSWG